MGDDIVNLDNIPDEDVFAKDDMFGALTDIESVVSRVIGTALMCYDSPENVGRLNVERARHVMEHAVRRINELNELTTEGNSK